MPYRLMLSIMIITTLCLQATAALRCTLSIDNAKYLKFEQMNCVVGVKNVGSDVEYIPLSIFQEGSGYISLSIAYAGKTAEIRPMRAKDFDRSMLWDSYVSLLPGEVYDTKVLLDTGSIKSIDNKKMLLENGEYQISAAIQYPDKRGGNVLLIAPFESFSYLIPEDDDIYNKINEAITHEHASAASPADINIDKLTQLYQEANQQQSLYMFTLGYYLGIKHYVNGIAESTPDARLNNMKLSANYFSEIMSTEKYNRYVDGIAPLLALSLSKTGKTAEAYQWYSLLLSSPYTTDDKFRYDIDHLIYYPIDNTPTPFVLAPIAARLGYDLRKTGDVYEITGHQTTIMVDTGGHLAFNGAPIAYGVCPYTISDTGIFVSPKFIKLLLLGKYGRGIDERFCNTLHLDSGK